MYKDSTLLQQDKINYARLRNTHLEYHGKEKKSKRRRKHETGEEATNDRSTMSCGKNSCEGRLHPDGSCEEDQNVASICIQRNKEVQGDGW